MKLDLRQGCSIAIAVDSLDPVVEMYTTALGLGPFRFEYVELPGASYRGRKAPARIRIATAPLGPCEMELIETMGGRPPHAEFLETRGEGMNHFNLDKRTHEGYLSTLSNLYHRGIEPFWGYPFGSFCYVESPDLAGVTFEIMVQRSRGKARSQPPRPRRCGYRPNDRLLLEGLWIGPVPNGRVPDASCVLSKRSNRGALQGQLLRSGRIPIEALRGRRGRDALQCAPLPTGGRIASSLRSRRRPGRDDRGARSRVARSGLAVR